MAATPAPPFETEFSEQAREDLQREPDLTPKANAVLLRAAKEVRRRLEMGENLALDLYSPKEEIVLRISLVPPEMVRIEGVESGGPAPEGALRV